MEPYRKRHAELRELMATKPLETQMGKGKYAYAINLKQDRVVISEKIGAIYRIVALFVDGEFTASWLPLPHAGEVETLRTVCVLIG